MFFEKGPPEANSHPPPIYQSINQSVNHSIVQMEI